VICESQKEEMTDFHNIKGIGKDCGIGKWQRFDAGSWFRYDDTVVTETNDDSVRKGSNRANGYIFMYVHSPLWDQCNVKHNRNINNNNCQDPLVCDSSV